MNEDIKHIGFRNQQNPNAHFDLVILEEMLSRSYEDHSPFQPHRVEFYLIILIESGKGKHIIDFKEYECRKGDVLTIRKNQIHQFQKGNSLKGRMLLFTNDFLVSYLDELEARRSKQLFNEMLGSQMTHLPVAEFSEIQAIVQRIEQEYRWITDQYSLGLIRNELHILVTKLMRSKSIGIDAINDRKYLGEFIRFQELTEKMVSRTLKVKDYADQMAVSTKTLNTIVRSVTSMSAKEFIDEVGIMQIKRLLINTDAPIKAIAHKSGFNETSNFFKYFKRLTGTTPEEFRAGL